MKWVTLKQRGNVTPLSKKEREDLKSLLENATGEGDLRNEDGKTADITVTYDDPNVILYTTTDQKMLDLGNSFNAYDIESHTYGRIRFYNPVKKIPERAFSRKTTLASISMPHGVESIGDEAFYHCDALTQVNIPDGVTSIGSSAFSGCDALTQVTICVLQLRRTHTSDYTRRRDKHWRLCVPILLRT